MQKDFSDSYRNALWQEKKNKILTRDNYTCAICGKHGDEHTLMHVHHPTYKNCKNHHAWDCPDEDLVTLCEDCHKKVHSGEPYKSASKNYQYYKNKASLNKFHNGTFYFVSDEKETYGLYIINIGQYDGYGDFIIDDFCSIAIFKNSSIILDTKETQELSKYHILRELSGSLTRVIGFICNNMTDNYISLNNDGRHLLGCLLQIAMFEDDIPNWKEDGDAQVNYDCIIKTASSIVGEIWLNEYSNMDKCQRADIMSKAYHLYSFIMNDDYSLPF